MIFRTFVHNTLRVSTSFVEYNDNGSLNMVYIFVDYDNSESWTWAINHVQVDIHSQGYCKAFYPGDIKSGMFCAGGYNADSCQVRRQTSRTQS